MNRIDNYERMYLGENLEMPNAASRIDELWQAILNKEELPFEPVTRVEKYLAKMIDSSIETPSPKTRLEEILNAICKGEKVDEATKNACKDEYLKYIYEQASGENMFVPNTLAINGVSYKGRTITLNGGTINYWNAQEYRNIPLEVGDTVTLRYRYISGELTSTSEDAVLLVPRAGTEWATASRLWIKSNNYKEDSALVTTLLYVPSVFSINTKDGTICNNLTFEVSFEKGDTTK